MKLGPVLAQCVWVVRKPLVHFHIYCIHNLLLVWSRFGIPFCAHCYLLFVLENIYPCIALFLVIYLERAVLVPSSPPRSF